MYLLYICDQLSGVFTDIDTVIEKLREYRFYENDEDGQHLRGFEITDKDESDLHEFKHVFGDYDIKLQEIDANQIEY